MLGCANLGPSVYLVFTVILSKVVRLLQNLVHMVPQTCTNSPLTTFNRFYIHNKNKHHETWRKNRRSAYSWSAFVNRVRRRTLSVCTSSVGKISGVRPLANSTPVLWTGMLLFAAWIWELPQKKRIWNWRKLNLEAVAVAIALDYM